jgi:cytidylate kinase
MTAASEAPLPAVVTIDGPAGSGKGTLAERLAAALGWHLLDSGALYRLVALDALQEGTPLDDEATLVERIANLPVRFQAHPGGTRVWLGDRDVSDAIRTQTCGRGAAQVAVHAGVRTALLAMQRRFREAPGLVADGRDMGTVVFPEAPLKVYLTATPEERASRRHKQLREKGIDANLADLLHDIRDRDRQDTERAVAPLKPADDAWILDTTAMDSDAVFDAVWQVTQRSLMRGHSGDPTPE